MRVIVIVTETYSLSAADLKTVLVVAFNRHESLPRGGPSSEECLVNGSMPMHMCIHAQASCQKVEQRAAEPRKERYSYSEIDIRL